MKYYSAIIFLILFTGCINSNDKTNNTKEKTKKEHRNYNFTIRINVEHSGKDFDYIINRKYYCLEGKNNFVYHDDHLLEQVTYEYIKNKKKGINVVDKTPTETIKYQLNRQQLDTIYSLASALYKVDTLNITNDTTRHYSNYDGYWAEITLTKSNLSYKVQLGGCSEENIVKRYQRLLSYIESTKKKIVFKSKKKR